MTRCLVISFLVVPLCFPLCFLAGSALASEVGRTTGLPVPRFVSTKTSPANVRVGPGISYPLKWTFVRRDLPLEIIAEFGHWRQIRDWEGKQGWMSGALLSGKRTALVAPWSGPDPVSLRSEAARAAPVVALVQPKVLVRIDGCDGKWCKVKARTRQGYLPQSRLWGAYPDEAF